jgi:HK97 family phage major capsid protein
MPNLVVLNPGDYHGFLTKKDADNNYMFLSMTLGGEASIEGMGIIHHRDIPAGKILMGDFKMLNIINYIDYALRVGWINDQLITNEFTMVGENRFFTFVRNLDQIAFVYDDIQNVTDGIKYVEA